MKKRIAALCLIPMLALLLYGCDREDVDKAADQMGDTAETIASDLKENMDSMIDDGQVKDGDGYIGEDDAADASRPGSTGGSAPEPSTGDGGIFTTEPDSSGDHI